MSPRGGVSDDFAFSPEKNARLKTLVERQLAALYGFTESDAAYLERHWDEAVHRTLACFAHVKNKYVHPDTIDPLNGCQQLVFLYTLAHEVFVRELREGASQTPATARTICDKVYNLYRALYTCEIYYEVDMPSYFYVEHPLGTVVGRAQLSDGLFLMQGCTIGGNGVHYPVLGKNVILFSNAKILGNCHVGDNVLFGANSYIKDMDIPSNAMVFGQYPDVIIKTNHPEIVEETIRRTFC